MVMADAVPEAFFFALLFLLCDPLLMVGSKVESKVSRRRRRGRISGGDGDRRRRDDGRGGLLLLLHDFFFFFRLFRKGSHAGGILRSGSGVDLPVLEVVGPHPERLPAHPANVGLLPRVEGGVDLEIPGSLEGLPAHLARKLPLGMDVLPVAVHGARGSEAFPAVHAPDGAVPRVLPHVDLQPVLVDEGRAAVRALVGPRPQVSLEVLIQGALVAHGLVAHVADVLLGVLLVPLVDLPVALEGVIRGESRSALLALELLEAACKNEKSIFFFKCFLCVKGYKTGAELLI